MGQLAAGVAAVVGDGADLAGGAAVGDVADSVGLGLAGEWQISSFGLIQRKLNQPLWLGKESLASKTILLHSEQGLGDTLQFCRYAKQVKALGARVVMEVPAPLLELLKSLEGVDVWVEQGKALPELLVTVGVGNGFILTAMLWGAFMAKLIDRKLKISAAYLFVLAALSFVGIIHSASPDGNMYLPWHLSGLAKQIPYQFTLAYVVLALMLFALSFSRESRQPVPDRIAHGLE